ncbi:hypothetical protein AK812_SmicGene19142 [Symbiodinium microadriaticum]|uniref:Uncharacterized protein n=1 Tax=Symbiodinium microadriaticum TaxID=2951 RepID=A0A1Q9DTC1_SYMMI|nr:hypothetical protein AK812_SmicGene19142 [Symbiodinium microadriaticum]
MDQMFLLAGFWKPKNCFKLSVLQMLKGGDALLSGDDPLPFLAMYLIQIPSLLALEIIRGTDWLKIDFCIGKIVKEGGTSSTLEVPSIFCAEAAAMLLGASAGLLWQLPPGLALITKTGGMVLGAAAGGVVWATYEEYREVLEEPSGGRWLLLLPETSENAKVQALRVWTKLKLGLTEAAVERSATFLGRGMLDSLLNRLGCWWCSVGAVEIAEKVVEAET